MAAGVTEKLWEIGDIVALIEAKEADKPTVCGPYKKARHSAEGRDGLCPIELAWSDRSDEAQSLGSRMVPGWSGPRHSAKRGPTKIWVFGQRPPVEDGRHQSNNQ